ncbi:hypothetical protein ACOME3_001353 [Neoechinorhynchus agilis]
MSGVGSKLKRYDPLVYPDNSFEDVVDFTNQQLIGVSSLPITHLQAPVRLSFLPNVPIECKVIKAEPIGNYTDMDFMSSYIYTIRLKHGKFVWEIEKRYRQFYHLHKLLSKYITTFMRRSISDVLSGSNPDSMDIPKLPLPNDLIAKLNSDNIGYRAVALEDYLNHILRYPKFRNHDATKEFLEVSVLSFIGELGPRFKEGLLKKRSMDDVKGKRFYNWIPFFFDCCKFQRVSKWFAVKDSYICYIRPETQELAFPILFDHGFSCNPLLRHTATLKITNLQKKLYLKAANDRQVHSWVRAIEEAMSHSTSFLHKSRFNSFAPVRKSCRAKWFINGRDYMHTLADAIERAKEEIYITDWWLSPEIYLRRPMKKGDKSNRLDHLIAKKANEGVRVYILVFQELKLALSLDSLHSKQQMRAKNPQFIKVIRHPNHVAATLMWSHHEKTVVIDQKIAFVGGIDLCFGRWDDEKYRLIDLGARDVAETPRIYIRPQSIPANAFMKISHGESGDDGSPQLLIFPQRIPGQNIALTMLSPLSTVPDNELKSDRSGVRQSLGHMLHTIQRGHQHHDSGPYQTSYSSAPASASSGNIGQSLSKHEKVVRKWQAMKKAVQTKDASDGQEDSDDEAEMQRDAKQEEEIKAAEIEYDEKGGAEMHLWPGKDYNNPYHKDFMEVKKFFEDNVDRNVIQRMPWHDEAAVVLGEAALDVARHFIQRWNDAKRAKHRLNREYSYLLPKSYGHDCHPDDSWITNVHDVDVQVLRSVSNWSAGISIIESSIMTAYCDLIKSANHYVFMENQFFITSTSQSDVVKNGIGSAIYDRIMRAHWNGENFRVYIVLPLLPGFDGMEAIKAVQHFTMRSIVSGENCLFRRLQTEGGVDDPQKYIHFFGMRNYDILNGNLVSEIIYVHSKLMIVDDRRAIVGSANINDRSLLGFRDSEMALLIEDKTLIPGRMNGKPAKVGPFCSSWRRTLFEQLLGVGTKSYQTPIDLLDPCTDEFFNTMKSISRKNTDIYLKVFGCLPNDEVRNFEELKKWTAQKYISQTNPQEGLQMLQENIQGYVVDLPLYFIFDENYYPLNKTKEGLAPYIMWT